MTIGFTVPIFVLGAVIFLIIVYGVMKSPEQEARDKQEEELKREMLEYFKRQKEQGGDTPPGRDDPS